MRTMFIIIVLGLLGLTGWAMYSIRTVTHDPAIWHVDPLTATPSQYPNYYRVARSDLTEWPVQQEAEIYAANAATVAAAFDAFVVAQPRVDRVAGTVEEGWLTYVQRTESFQFPDYISVRFYDIDDTGKSTLAIYSRSRFGQGDMGVNEARVKSWLTSIDSFKE